MDIELHLKTRHAELKVRQENNDLAQEKEGLSDGQLRMMKMERERLDGQVCEVENLMTFLKIDFHPRIVKSPLIDMRQ